MKDERVNSVFTPILIGGSLILLISFAIRSTFGLFQIPIASDFLWNRSEFSLAIAIQNLAWGVGTPLFSAFAEKYGDRKAIALGLILYAIGIFISSTATTPEAHQTLNLLIGFGIALYFSYTRLVLYHYNMTERPLFFFGVLSMIIGAQLFLTGFLAEMIIRNKKIESNEIAEKIGF